jgi:hypothetical protein
VYATVLAQNPAKNEAFSGHMLGEPLETEAIAD